MVEEREKLRVIHDLTFRSGATVTKEKWSKEPGEAKEAGGMSLNADADWQKASNGDHHVVSVITAKIWDREKNPASNNRRQERVR